MNYEKPSKLIVFLSILLIIINLFLSYIFTGESIPYIFGNVFGFTLIAITISSFFTKYRNSRSRWIITLNTMIIAFMLILSGGLLKMSKKINDKNITHIKSFSGENSQAKTKD